MYKRKSKFWTFVFSFVPGAGHMYLGLQRQGIQLMLLFFSQIFLLNILGIGILGVFLPVIWFYSMFDAMSKVSSEAVPQDDDLPVVKWIKREGPIVGNKAKYLGYGLIGLGGYMILERILLPTFNILFDWRIKGFIQSGVIAALLIVLGVKLLSGERAGRN